MTTLIHKFIQKLFALRQLARRFSPGRFLRLKQVRVARQSTEAFVATLPPGVEMWIEPQFYIAKVYVRGSYEPNVVRFLHGEVRSGMICIDVEANVGYYALLLAHLVGREGPIIALEPTPKTVSMLERNRDLNNFSQIEIVPVALSDKNGSLDFRVGKPAYEVYNTVGAVVHPSADPDAFVQITVPCITLDSYLRDEGIDHVDLIKLDIEGSELAALQGMEQTLAKNPEATLLIEFSDVTSGGLGYSVTEMERWLTERGWRLRIVGPFGTLVVPTPAQAWSGQIVAARQCWRH